MNCLEFRRRLTSAPDDDDPHLEQHASQCPSCAAFAERSKQLDGLVARAARVPVPEGLAARVLLAQDFSEREPPRHKRRNVVALAASLLLAIAAATGWWALERTDPLADEIITLVNTASFALQAEGPVSQAELESALEPTGVRLSGPIGDVTFAGPCVVRGKLAGHVVVRGATAKVTVLFMPNEHVSERSEFSSYHFRGVLLPSDRGTVAIIAAPGEPISNLERRMLDAYGQTT